MLSSNARSLLPYAVRQLLPPPPTSTRRKASPHAPRSRPTTPVLLLLLLLLLALLGAAELAQLHPALQRRVPPSPAHTLKVAGNWHRLRPLFPSTPPLRSPLDARAASAPSSTDNDDDMLPLPSLTEAEKGQLYLAPDARAHEPDMTLAELEAWARAYTPPSVTGSASGAGMGTKKSAGKRGKGKRAGVGKRSGRARRLVNQD
ncbi:hypothetical protein CALCODRAFT_88890 [Calocera cornea HHB12733]|uniref:Uncharacterized protein n=1 Tax=Calocera cornea HHB12733 TaxID=1353952 RepID=A0A165DBG8_9BASI|nr:hypothetical protein CALCODRAFT_88890 [Calocera cornea HHB12733]